MLARALMNLLSNAIRYTRRGGVLIGARREGAGFRVEIVDTGIGIAPDQQAEIFEEFWRLDADADQRDRGCGLGLAIVERIARVLEHPLRVQSVPGRGSRFSLCLPAGSPGPALAPAATEAGAATRSEGALLVVIENEAAIREGMQVLLQGWGYAVLTAPSPEVAICLLQRSRQRPAAVIADYHLDGRTGTDAIGMVRAGFGPDIPAVVITADRMPEVQREVEALDVPMLNKPVRPAQLRSLLAKLLEPQVA
jgi:CheY-like chemotaxis protein